MPEELIERFRDEARRARLELSLVVESADGGSYPAPLLRVVLSNLLRNALHYTDRGFVRLVLRSGRLQRDRFRRRHPARETRCCVPALRPRGTTRGDGIGLGLSLVQRICQRQGWRIRLDGTRTAVANSGLIFCPLDAFFTPA